VARSYLQLARGFQARGCRVDFVLCRATGPYLSDLEKEIEVIELEPEGHLQSWRRVIGLSRDDLRELMRPVLLTLYPPRVLPYIESLAHYIDSVRPDVILSGKTHTNLLALWGSRLAATKTRVVISERTTLSIEIASSWIGRISPGFARRESIGSVGLACSGSRGSGAGVFAISADQ
jgi:hypothetical protein